MRKFNRSEKLFLNREGSSSAEFLRVMAMFAYLEEGKMTDIFEPEMFLKYSRIALEGLGSFMLLTHPVGNLTEADLYHDGKIIASYGIFDSVEEAEENSLMIMLAEVNFFNLGILKMKRDLIEKILVHNRLKSSFSLN
jgi:hypothetical protein